MTLWHQLPTPWRIFTYDIAYRAEQHGELQHGGDRHGALVTEVHQDLSLNCSPFKDFSRAIVHNTQLGMILGFDRYAASGHVARDKLLNHSRNCKKHGYCYDYLVVVQTLTSTG